MAEGVDLQLVPLRREIVDDIVRHLENVYLLHIKAILMAEDVSAHYGLTVE